jgi:hypothetical protein
VAASADSGLDVNELMKAELISDIRGSGRAHDRYLQVMDRAFLSQYLQDSDAVPGRVADLNTASHAPTPQPFVVPNFVSPAAGTGTIPKAG